MVQFENMTLNSKDTSIEAITLYQMIKKLEVAGCVVKNMSFLKLTRSGSSSQDGFDIAHVGDRCYKLLDGDEDDQPAKKQKKYSNKNVFRSVHESIKESKYLDFCYRFRWEKVGGNVKAQKPYVITTVPISMKSGCPILVPRPDVHALG